MTNPFAGQSDDYSSNPPPPNDVPPAAFITEEAQSMTAFITGLCAAAVSTKDVLRTPLRFTRVDGYYGVIEFRLASGMPVHIEIRVEPVR